MNDYTKFQKLLAWFVNQLNINNGIVNGKKVTGTGYSKNSTLRKRYIDFRNYDGFDLDCSINHQYGNYATRLNYIHLAGTGLNIIPEFENQNKMVDSLYIGYISKQVERKSESISISSLGLNDEEPNQALKDFFDLYKHEIIKYKNNCSTINNDISYWLGGARYEEDVSQKFIENGVYAIGFEHKDLSDIATKSASLNEWINKLSSTAAKKAFSLFVQMKAGDKIAIKSSFPKTMPNNEKYVSTLRIKAIGTVIDNIENEYRFDDNLGHTIPVSWETTNLKKDLEIGTYKDTIHQVTKEEDIKAIFYCSNNNLEIAFMSWLDKQRKSNGNPYKDNYKNCVRRSLKSNCAKLKDLNLQECNLFYQTSLESFIDLKNKIIKSSYYKSVDEQAQNGVFSSSLALYEKFLSTSEHESPPTPLISLKELAMSVLEDTHKAMTDIEIWEYALDKGLDKRLNSVGKTPWQSIYAILSNYKDGIPNPDDQIKIIDTDQRRKFVLKRYADEEENSQSSYINYNYDVGISEQKWLEMLDNAIINQRDIELLRKWLYFDGKSTCREVGKAFNEHPSAYITPTVSMARRIYEYTNCKTRSGENRDIAWWNIPFIGKYINSKEHFEWTIRPELIKALNESGITASEPMSLISYSKEDFLIDVYMTSDKYDEIISLLERKKNIILQGAPGVGKSYLAKRLAYSILGVQDESRVAMVQFHQSYSYEDFIEGYRPDGKGGFKLERGIFYKFCQTALNEEGNYYFIIDEINRGNISKIMGELMLLIENDKRGEEFAVPLTYSDELFYVPKNVFIIGMMNTADRGLAMLDYALRRRFCFAQIEPAFSNPAFIEYIKKDNEELGTRILNEMRALNADIKNDLGTGFQIGHSYFCNCDNIDEQWYKSILKYEIIPLLDEYWFDNDKQHSKWVEGLLPNEKNPN